jgi:hypothetical protein
LFDRYTILVDAATKHTSVYCEKCEYWVEQYVGDQLSTNTVDELYEKIVDDHKHQVLGKPVKFDDSIERFI